MTTFSDSFTRANETPLTSPNWQTLTSSGGFVGAGLNLASNAVTAPATGNPNFSAITTTAMTASKTQFAQATFTTSPTGFATMGVIVNGRITASGSNGFTLAYSQAGGEVIIIRWTSNFEFANSDLDAGAGTTTFSQAATFANGDIIRLECEDKGVTDYVSLRAYKNGVIIGSEVIASYPTATAAGQPGLFSDAAANGVMDSFNGGDISAAASAKLLSMLNNQAGF
jgi:hypothetical protein